MVLEIPPPKLHPSGGVFVKYSADGGSFAYYTSGRMAAAYERMGAGFYCYFYADDRAGTTLLAIDPMGCGYCSWKNGKPRLTSRKHGGTQTDENGSIIRLWTTLKPLKPGAPVEMDLSPNIHVTFGSRQQITAKLSVAGLTEEYQLGDVQKMASDSYLAKAVSQIKMGPERGKYVLDVDKCRMAAQENRERREAMMMKDLDNAQVHITEDFMQKHPQLKPIVASTDELQASVGRGEWSVDVFISKEKMAATLSDAFPTLKYGDTLRGDPFSTTIASLPASKPDVLDALLTESGFDGKALPLSSAIKGASGRYRPEHGSHYQTPRKRLLELKSPKYDEAIASEPKDTLVVVCCLAGWMPACRRMEPVLEMLNGELAKAAKGGGGGGASRPGTGGGASANADATPSYVLRKFDMSESRFLRNRHNINTLPMYLMYMGGKLAYASNTLNGYGTSREDLLAQVATTRLDAQRGNFLPPDFRFGATDNKLTATFSETLSKTSTKLKS